MKPSKPRWIRIAWGLLPWLVVAVFGSAYVGWTRPTELQQVRINIRTLEAEQREIAADAVRQRAECVAQSVELAGALDPVCAKALELTDKVSTNMTATLQRKIDRERKREAELMSAAHLRLLWERRCWA